MNFSRSAAQQRRSPENEHEIGHYFLAYAQVVSGDPNNEDSLYWKIACIHMVLVGTRRWTVHKDWVELIDVDIIDL